MDGLVIEQGPRLRDDHLDRNNIDLSPVIVDRLARVIWAARHKKVTGVCIDKSVGAKTQSRLRT